MTDSSTKNQKPNSIHVPVGRLGRTKGLKGWLRLQLFNPESDVLDHCVHYRLETQDQKDFQANLKKHKPEKDHHMVLWEDFENVDVARTLTGAVVSVLREDLPALSKGQYYHVDLIGSEVFDLEKNRLGKLVQILSTASNDVWSIVDGKQELLIPDLPGVVVSVDVQSKTIVIDPPVYVDEV
ncbi:MAG: ribosome maturation factor RimM [Bdellovibrionota bacterium]